MAGAMKQQPVYHCRSCGDEEPLGHIQKYRHYCEECFEEVTEGKIPKVTGPNANTPCGGMGNPCDPDPAFENIQRLYEE